MALEHLPENPRQEARAWNLQLGLPGFKYADLNRVRRLEALDRAFISELESADATLAHDLRAYRDAGSSASIGGISPDAQPNAPGETAAKGAVARTESWSRLQESELLIRVAPHLGRFIARLFHIELEHQTLCERVLSHQIIFRWKREFLERRILKNPPALETLGQLDPVDLEFAYRQVVDEAAPDAALSADPERELAVVTMALAQLILLYPSIPPFSALGLLPQSDSQTQEEYRGLMNGSAGPQAASPPLPGP